GGDLPHAVMLPAVQGRCPARGRMGMARIEEPDPASGVIDQRQCPMIWKPGRWTPVVGRGLSQQLRRPDADGVWTVIGSGTDRPAIQPPEAGTDQAVAVGVEENGVALTRLELRQLTA